MPVIVVLFSICVAVQVIFFLFFLAIFLRPDRKKVYSQRPVSVIIVAHQEVVNLRVLVPLLLDQDHPDFEVIIALDRSTDDSYDYLFGQAQKDSRLKMVTIDRVPERMNPKKYALTLGINKAEKEIILLTDADCRPASRFWIQRMSSEFDGSTEIVLGYSPYLTKPGILNAFIRFETLLTSIQCIGMAMAGNPYMGVGRNLAYRKSLFQENGFGDLMQVTGGDDDLFVNRYANSKNLRVCLDSEAVVVSIPKKSMGTFLNQKLRHLSVGKHYKTKDKLIIGLFQVTWVASWLLGIGIIVIFPPQVNVVLAMIFRSFLVILAVHVASARLGHKFEVWQVPFLDFLYAIYYISTGPRALLAKEIRWTN